MGRARERAERIIEQKKEIDVSRRSEDKSEQQELEQVVRRCPRSCTPVPCPAYKPLGAVSQGARCTAIPSTQLFATTALRSHVRTYARR